jgi:hypothetical protein
MGLLPNARTIGLPALPTMRQENELPIDDIVSTEHQIPNRRVG